MFRRVLGHIRRRSVAFLALLFAVGGGAMAAPALGDTTIGQTGFTNDAQAQAACLVGPVLLADTNYAVPSGGWITSFSYESTLVLPVPTEQVDFLVLRPAQGNYTVVGVTDATLFEDGGLEIVGAMVQGNLMAIPVQGGDILGFYVPSSLLVCARSVASGGGVISPTGPPSLPSVGESVSLPGGDPTLDLNLSANLITVPTREECRGFGWFSLGFKSRGQCLIFSRTH
jgi:hypothetical protein